MIRFNNGINKCTLVYLVVFSFLADDKFKMVVGKLPVIPEWLA
jgi:hypothetical protein